MPPCVLIADSDPATRVAVVGLLLQAGYRVVAEVPDQIYITAM